MPILVALTAGSLYDPTARATASGVPSRALDGDPNTSWFATTPADGDMNVGYLVDLENAVSVQKLRLLTKTAGFSLQVFGSSKDKRRPRRTAPTGRGWGRPARSTATAPVGSASTSPPADGDKAGDGELILPLETRN